MPPARRRSLAATAAASLALSLLPLVAAPASAAAATLSVGDVRIVEGSDGTSDAVFQVTLAGSPSGQVAVDYRTADGSAQSAGAGPGSQDYIASSGSLVFAADGVQTVRVKVAGDVVFEDDESFALQLSGASGATLADGTGTATVTNDDDAPTLSVSSATAPEATSRPLLGPSPGRLTFTVSKSGQTQQPVTVNYATTDVTAAAGADYTATSGALELAPAQTSATVTVELRDDALDEADETLSLQLSKASAASVPPGSERGSGTIEDDDGAPSVSVDDVTVGEGAGQASFTLMLSAVSGQPVTVDYATSDGSATEPADYTATTGTATIPAGARSTTIAVPILDDDLDEPAETFTVTLSNASNATTTDAATGTIADDEPGAELSVSDAPAVVEGTASAAGTALFTVTLTGATAQSVRVDYATEDDTAQASPPLGAQPDYSSTRGTLTFAPGETTKTVEVALTGDQLPEPAEMFRLRLSRPINATLTDDVGGATVQNDDGPAQGLRVSDVRVDEGTGPAGSLATFSLTLDAPAIQTVTVDYATADGSATGGVDYTPTSGTATILLGTSTAIVVVPVTGDRLDEPDETFMLELSRGRNAALADPSGVATIIDDDATPSVRIDDGVVSEGSSGTTEGTVTVRLSGPSGREVSVDYATSDGTATAGQDYTSASGRVVFSPGETVKQIELTVVADAVDEPDEDVRFTLTGPQNASLADGEGRLTIIDDDATPRLSVSDATVVEGNTGTTPASFTITLSEASSRPVTVAYATSDDTARQPGDYSTASGTVTIAAGDTLEVVEVAVVGDERGEANEAFTLALAQPSNAELQDSSGTGTITDDDGAPALSIADVRQAEGDGAVSRFTFSVRLDPAADQPVDVAYQTVDGTADSSDYVARRGTVSFAPGQREKTISVEVLGDTVDEKDETFTVALSGATGGAALRDDSATATLIDDDLAGGVSVQDSRVSEGDEGPARMAFVLTLNGDAANEVTVDYATSDGTATAGSDYTATSGSVTFAPGDTSETVTVSVTGDTVDETDETLTLTLSNPRNATLDNGKAKGTITDDEGPSSFTVSDTTSVEGTGGDSSSQITVSRSGETDSTVSVGYATADGTARAGSDYTSSSGRLSFAAGQSSQTVSVPITADGIDEPDETLTVQLSQPSQGATLVRAAGTVALADDDAPPAFSVDDLTVLEGDSGTKEATFTVRKTGSNNGVTTVRYLTQDATATSGQDYGATTGSLTFAADDDTQTVAVQITGDTTEEPDETFLFSLDQPGEGATIGDGQGTGTISDDDDDGDPAGGGGGGGENGGGDGAPTLSIADVSVEEGDSGQSNAVLTVTRSGPAGADSSVRYDTAPGSATPGVDYTTVSGELLFESQATTATLTVPISGDQTTEPNENFLVRLSAPTGASLEDADAVVSILDDDTQAGGAGGPAPTPAARLIDDSCPRGQVPENSRQDDNGNTHEYAIDCMVWWAIAKGTSATEYKPGVAVSREQMATFVVSLIERSGGAMPAGGDAFPDDNDSFHEANIDKLAAAGVVSGRGDGSYGPRDTVTRGQMAKFLVLAYEYRSGTTLGASADYFADDNGSTHEQSINRAAEAGFTGGRSSGYDPAGPVQRDQMASFLARALDLLVEEGTTPRR